MKELFDKLIGNGWLTKEEAQNFYDNPDIIECMEKSTSPVKSNIFNALNLVPLNSFKVLILGKDPYPNPKDAQGLAFSSMDKSTPDSLKNIFKSLDKTYGSNLFEKADNDLTSWAKQGVLLLNTGLTYQKIDSDGMDKKEKLSAQNKTQNRHMKIWRPFIKLIIKKILSIKDRPTVYMLWGNDAHNVVFSEIKNKDFKSHLHERGAFIIPDTQTMILQCAHPSPLSVNRGGDFLEMAPEYFKDCDEHLKTDRINWTKL